MQIGKIEQLTTNNNLFNIIHNQIKTAKLSYGEYYCECGKQVVKGDNYCSKCGAELKFIKCEHKECYSKKYIDYDRTCYEICCMECNTEVADVGFSGYIRAKEKYNVTKEY